MTTSTLTIATRFCGPPGSANGGYIAGLLAARLGAPAHPTTVTLRSPPPLDTSLEIDVSPAGLTLSDGPTLVAEGAPGSYASDPVPSVGLAAAEQAQSSYAGLTDHPFPTCFVCGTSRGLGDGMLLMPGLIGPGRTACVWTPDLTMGDPDDPDVAAGEFVWSALDCPGGWTSDIGSRPLVLGRVTASYDKQPRIGEPYVVVGALLGIEGRRTRTATTIYTGSGGQVARAEQVWIAIDPASFARR